MANNIFTDLIEFLNTPVVGGKKAKKKAKASKGGAPEQAQAEERGVVGGILDALNEPLPNLVDDAAEALNKPVIGGKKAKKKAKKAKAKAKAKAKKAGSSKAGQKAASERDGGGRGFIGQIADALNTPVQETLDDAAEMLNKPVVGGKKKGERGVVGRTAEALNRGPGSRSKSSARRASRIRRPQDAQLGSPDVQAEIRRRARELKAAQRKAEAAGKMKKASGFQATAVSLDGLRRRYEKEMAQQAQLHADTEDMTYTVKPGDTLSGIAQRLYGKSRRWTRIYRANQDRIDNPNVIFPGQVLVIPGTVGDED